MPGKLENRQGGGSGGPELAIPWLYRDKAVGGNSCLVVHDTCGFWALSCRGHGGFKRFGEKNPGVKDLFLLFLNTFLYSGRTY